MSTARRQGRATLRLVGLLLLGILAAVAGQARGGSLPPDEGTLLRVSVLDVGQGDAILIQTPDGKTLLIDAGPGSSSDLLLRQLSWQGVARIDLAVNTHPHEDHLGGFVSVLERMPCRLFTDPGVAHTTRAYENLMLELKARQIPTRVARRGQTYKVGSAVVLDVLAPEEPLLDDTLNNVSVVTRLTYGNFSMMLMGDAEAEVEERLLSHGVQPTVVLKVAHHGSHSSSTGPFLDRLNLRVAIISCGVDNRYGHPHRETLEALERRGVAIYRTDQDGQVRVLTDGRKLWVETFAPQAIRSGGVDQPHPTRVDGPFKLSTGSTGQFERSSSVTPGGQASPGGDQANQTAVPPGGYVASIHSKVFHLSTCANARRISPENLQHFDTREAAIEAGKTPARCCNP